MTEPPSPQQPLVPATVERAAAALRVVAVGASAGGLDPLTQLLAACPLGAGLSCIVVQHMGSHQPSTLPLLLQPHTALTVMWARDGLPLEADHVYVIAPGTLLSVAGGRLRVLSPALGRMAPHPVDYLMESIAREFGTAGVGVVLSGMGSDGSVGLRAIASAGGLALVQQPETAQFDSMPRSAAAAVGPAARLMLPSEVPALVTALVKVRAAAASAGTTGADATGGAAPATPDDLHDHLAAILARVARVTGHDFSLYKTTTLRRRIDRRVALHGLGSLAEYRRLLDDSPQEPELLFRELLIGVTSFFRDQPVWDALAADVLPMLIRRAIERGERRLRAWVVGCSTGEEAYTLAMLCREVLDRIDTERQLAVQIFATDVSADAVDFARRGRYAPVVLERVSQARRERFFRVEDEALRVTKALRETVLFARHDVIGDAPFSRLDLVCCRNLLIYFKPSLQQRVLALMHYVLRPGGCLLLGSSETVGRAEARFEQLDAKLRIFRRLDSAPSGAAFPIRAAPAPEPVHQETVMTDEAPPSGAMLAALADRLILDEFAPPAVLVDANGDILYVSGHTGNFLEPAAGKANWNVHAMAREGLRAALAAALRQVALERQPVDRADLKGAGVGGAVGVELALRPVRLAGRDDLVLVLFRDVPLPAPRRRRRGPHDEALQRALEEAQALREEMRSSQEELQSTNEELQSTNEELQSANEELTTSKEEMQAMNEELHTVNAELLTKIEDLAQAQSDLKNLLNSTQIATLFLDGRFNVRRFTEQAKKLINLRDSDVGRPLTDLTTSLDYAELADDVAEVLRTLEFRERTIRTRDGRWYSVRIMPYRTQENVIDGSVITFVDVTAAKVLEARLRQSHETPGPGASTTPAD